MANIKERYSHITIGLHCRVSETWDPIRALDWNDIGFNFYSGNQIKQTSLVFKKGIAQFEGMVMWRSVNTNDDIILATIVNELLFKQVNTVTHNEDLHARLFKLMRTPGMVPEKRKMLALLGVHMTDSEMQELIEMRKKEHPMFRCGVKVGSEAWSAIVNNALNISSVVISLEKVKDNLTNK